MNRRSDERLDPLTLAAKHLLDQSVEALDQKTVLSVQRARVNALSQARAHRPWLRWASALALASIAALAVTMWLWQANGTHHSHLLLEDLELMQSPENLELSEDLEFYDWLSDGTASTG